MEILLDKQAVRTIRLAASDAIEEGDTEALQEDIFEAFPEERIEALEQMLGGEDFMDLLGEVLEEWSGDDVDELLDLLETSLGDYGVDLRYHSEEDFEEEDVDGDDGDDLDSLGGFEEGDDDDL